jgi:hypothetical protein
MKRIHFAMIYLVFTITVCAAAYALFEGGHIVGSSQIFSIHDIEMKVTPHTAKDANNNYYQEFEITNNRANDLGGVYVAFRFDHPLSQRDIHELVYSMNGNGSSQTELVNRNAAFFYQEMGGKHVYYLTTPSTFPAGETRYFNIRFSYQTPQPTSKYDMALWKGSLNCIIFDTCDYAYILDPWTLDIDTSSNGWYMPFDTDVTNHGEVILG